MELPPIPASIADFIPYLEQHSNDDFNDLLTPYKAYEGRLRELYAQQPESHLISDPLVNTTPLFAGHESAVKVRARNLSKESDKDVERYLLPLSDDERKADGSPGIVASIKEFKTNFNLFSESSLVDLDWSNIVAAGSSVVTALLPVKAPHNESKRALRSYYHEKLAPASDVDLFIYGLNEEEAVQKIKQIEGRIRDSILSETTTIRTKNAITIVSEYPTRHVQIVLRLYKNVSEVLTGFDVDCSCVAYDGKQVWASPRAIAAFMTQINTIDLTRRSPSYENRLSKYSHRGFEVFFPDIDRARIDPTIFERSFSRVMGLARLLVLEKLPHPTDRDDYLAKRRTERGRPSLPWNARYRHQLPGNVKDAQPDDVAEWVEADDVSNYHTFTVPYGPKYNAKRIEKLLFTKDLLLNAEWNRPKDRETDLHRHPAFFGSIDDVIHDCCGFCPKPKTDEDFAASEEEEKIYITGDIKFITDNPGRQTIGSFHPIDTNDWCEMAYVSNTASLCQAIVDCDLEYVQNWLAGKDVDVNQRDHTGRTALQLACLCSTPEIVQCLIDHGARIVARIVDGMTALHVAAHRGNTEMVKALLVKSEANEEQESRKEDLRKEVRRAMHAEKKASQSGPGKTEESEDEDEPTDSDSEDLMEGDDLDDSDDSDQMTEGSFVKVKTTSDEDAVAKADDDDEPDIYNIDVLAWDSPVSPLHLAIMGGHIDTIELLTDQFGADVLLPVKLLNESKTPRAAILTVALALQLPLEQANKTIQALLSRGASSTQADMNQVSALHYVVNEGKDAILKTMFDSDGPAAAQAINHVLVSGWQSNVSVVTPLLTAIRREDVEMVDMLLSKGAKHHIDFEAFANAYRHKFERQTQNPDEMKKIYQKSVNQPIIEAARAELPELVEKLLSFGADHDTMPAEAYQRAEFPERTYNGEDKSLLDILQYKLQKFKEFAHGSANDPSDAPSPLYDDKQYMKDLKPGTYKHWLAQRDLEQAKSVKEIQVKQYNQKLDTAKEGVKGHAEKLQAVNAKIEKFERAIQKLVAKGAKGFYEVFSEIKKPSTDDLGGFGYQNTHRGYDHFAGTNSPRGPYITNLSYLRGDLTPEMAKSYDHLFEAAWIGDSETVKTMTIAPTGPGSLPLKVAVQDLRGFSPFSLAVIRGHAQLASIIVDIATAQYQSDEKTERYKYSLRGDGDIENYDDSISGESNDDSIKLYAELVDDKFTVDDIGALAENVKSKVSPMTMICWQAEVWRAVDQDEPSAKALFMPRKREHNIYAQDQSQESWLWFNTALEKERHRCQWSLIRYAIGTNNIELLKSLLRLGCNLAARKEGEDAVKVFDVMQTDFDFAVRLGRTEMIGEIIRSTGAAIPLQKLVQKSGVQVQEKPRYYQGLSVRGQKRKDWADAGRGVTRAPIERDHSPLLAVSFEGNLDTVEYFLTDAPLRRYQEFVDAHKDDKRIQILGQAQGGIDKALTSWLGSRNKLIIHMAVMSRPKKDDDSHPLLSFLIRNMPETVDVRSSAGTTPLQLAFELQRFNAAKMLIAAGANQATRNDAGENLLHTIVSSIHTDAALFRSLLVLFDPNLLNSMVLERCGGTEPGALTPVAFYIQKAHIHSPSSEDILRVLLEYSKGKDLEIMDGAGDYPLHTLVRKNATALARWVINYNPSLLHRENATGMTPLDVVKTSYLRSRMDNPPAVRETNVHGYNLHHGRTGSGNLLEKAPSEFIERTEEEARKEEENASTAIATWKMCMESRPGKRKLVTLFDANEVAKRLVEVQKRRSEENRRREQRMGPLRFTVGREDGEERETDEVGLWMGKAQGFRRYDYEAWVNEAEKGADPAAVKMN